MSKLPYPFPELAEELYIPSSYNELHNITKYDLLEKEGYYTYIVLRSRPTHPIDYEAMIESLNML